jgi:predicted nucleic acid-binding protein
VRLATWLHRQDKDKGFPVQVAQIALARLEADLDDGVLEEASCDYGRIIDRARKISNTHTWRSGYPSLDVLHVATARYLRASRFLTFDANQRKLAEAEGMSPL